ncbi:30S ribosomal protein S16 [Candidatus Gottesmanbacteria bacterium]|nr:30S ribosomal protein S16 [Candidatus Gottesmanbacteria bacterium]
MPVKIRLQRTGKKDQALYRLIVTDQKSKSNGKSIAILGNANLKVKPQAVKYDKKELEKWLSQGAQLSDSVRKLLSL